MDEVKISLGEKFLSAASMFMLNWALVFILAAIVLAIGWDFYARFYRIENTDNVDLIKRYQYLQLIRKSQNE